MDDSQDSNSQSAPNGDQDNSYNSTTHNDKQAANADWEAGWSASGEPTDGSFVLGYN